MADKSFNQLADELHAALADLERKRPDREAAAWWQLDNSIHRVGLSIADFADALQQGAQAMERYMDGWVMVIPPDLWQDIQEVEALYDALPDWMPARLGDLLVSYTPWLVRWLWL